MRATPRSKLMEEAKKKADTLLKLRPQFDEIVKQFLKDVRKANQGNFQKWALLFPIVDECTTWEPTAKSYMNLRLQNPPGQDGMFQVILRMIFLTQFCSNGFIQPILRQVHNTSQAAAE